MVSRWYRRDEGRVVGPKKKDILWHTKGKYGPQFIRILCCYLLTTWRQMRFSFSSFSMNNEFFGGAQCAVVWMSFQLCSPWFLRNDKFSNKLDRSVLLQKKSRDIFISLLIFFHIFFWFFRLLFRAEVYWDCVHYSWELLCVVFILLFFGFTAARWIIQCFFLRWWWSSVRMSPTWHGAKLKNIGKLFLCFFRLTYFPTL